MGEQSKQDEPQKRGETIERILAKPKTVAIMTDQSVSMVYKLVADGTYPSVRIGRSVRIPLELRPGPTMGSPCFR